MKFAILISVCVHVLIVAFAYHKSAQSSKGDRLGGISTIIKNYNPYSALPMSKNVEDRRDERQGKKP